MAEMIVNIRRARACQVDRPEWWRILRTHHHVTPVPDGIAVELRELDRIPGEIG